MMASVRPVTVGMRRWFLLDAFLVFVTGIQCFVLSEYTAQFFAWTINPPLTAAFIGAAYWAAFPLVLLSARETAWARARVAVYGVLVFTTVTTIATFLHLDRFHLSDPQPLALLAAWAWLVVYVAVPPSLLILLLRQWRAPGGDPARRRPLPAAFRGALALQTVVMLAIGLVLVLAPHSVTWWPWTLTPLTGRAVGAWLLGIGVTVGHSAWENDWTRLKPGMTSYVLFGLLQLVAVARYVGVVNWGLWSAWVYILMLLSMLILGVYGARMAWRAYPEDSPLPGLHYSGSNTRA